MTTKIVNQENEFIFCVDGLEDPERIKDKIRRVLDHILGDDAFIIRDIGLIGTHSICKFAVTFAHGQGCNKVEISKIAYNCCMFFVLFF